MSAKKLDTEDREVRGGHGGEAKFGFEGLHAELSADIIGAAIQVQKTLGPWLLESAYEACLAHELTLRGHRVDRQVSVGLRYRDLNVPYAYKMDLVVDDLIVVELKVVSGLDPTHESQVLSYLRFSGLEVGLLINFGKQPLMPKGVRRFILSPSPSPSSV